MGKNEMPTPEAIINKNNLDQSGSGEGLKKEQATEIKSIYPENIEEGTRQAEAKIPGWIEMGKTLGIKPELTEEWEKMVKNRAGDVYHGSDLDEAIEVMQKINDGATAEDVKKTLGNQGHSGASCGMVHLIVTTFSPRGKDVFEEIDKIEK